jgi:hypothetical protein
MFVYLVGEVQKMKQILCLDGPNSEPDANEADFVFGWSKL